MNSDSIIIAFIFITHLFLNCWALLAFMNASYLLYNAFFLLSLLWSIHETKASAPVFVALLINVVSIPLDVAFIPILWVTGFEGFRYTLSIVASFATLFYRLITSLIIFKIFSKRRESEANQESIGSVTRDLSKYINSYVHRTPSQPPQQQGVAQP